MNKVWFIYIFGNIEGPFDYEELKKNEEITPDTFVWKEGFKDWVPLKEVEELKEIFEEEEEQKEETTDESKQSALDDEVLALEFDPFQWMIWLFLILTIILYVLFKLG